MYTLRYYNSLGEEINLSLGDYYAWITRASSKSFDEIMHKEWGGNDPEIQSFKDGIAGFICGTPGQYYSINYNQDYYIMTDSGRTFTKIYVPDDKTICKDS